MNHYYPNQLVLSRNILVVGGIFSVIAGFHELYQSTKNQHHNVHVLLRVSAHMTAGFIYGISLTYFWQIPTAFSMYNAAKGFYGK